ncbi:hypothetical protein [Aporhodopirellula aestuarii]|uniref:Uncharacterized protein n=1 Tax=Aporhodopirellula aestuarii TaxID=2950107 RepID=A0ABT0TZ51_9BACT|nr:hypothetical protein [Aporhodopirellula aestuarii]MCM2369888.1 hypothetical protein [Aporhodopirellula aestuarii]
MSDQESIEPPNESPIQRRIKHLRFTLIALILGWTYCYNVLIKEQGIVRAFFEILDTISDDFVMGTLVTIAVGIGIVVVFSFTKLYTQIVANIYSFRIIETLVVEELAQRRFRTFASKLLRFEDQPLPAQCCPERISSLLLSFTFLYVMSWVYLILFSEALFFVSWSAGVDLPLDDPGKMLFLPTLALAIPFSARVMAYVRYPYAQDYADFMPTAVFALLIVFALGSIFESDDQKFFLLQVWQNPEYLKTLLKNGTVLAFIPVFFEGVFWIIELNRMDKESTARESMESESNGD